MIVIGQYFLALVGIINFYIFNPEVLSTILSGFINVSFMEDRLLMVGPGPGDLSPGKVSNKP